jgi:CubicO group peptidase (beta-lactamase class C family)
MSVGTCSGIGEPGVKGSRERFVFGRIALIGSIFLTSACGGPTQPVIADLDGLSERLETLRQEYSIPALSVGVLQTDGSPWTVGLGSTSVSGPTDSPASSIAPTSTSVFHLASITKTFATAVILQLAQEGKLSLDDNVSKYGIQLENSSDIRVRHLMSHTSEGVPGDQFRYNGDRFALLDRVIEQAGGKPFAQLLAERITTPLRLTCTGPSSSSTLRAALVPGFGEKGNSVQYPTLFSSAAGMVSCTRDLLEYSRAWDAGQLVTSASRNLAWTPTSSRTKGAQPYGLGWFVDESLGTKVVWHYGYWTAISSLIVKIPDRGLTFVLLANNDQLSAKFPLGAGELLSSPFARAFLAWALQREIGG